MNPVRLHARPAGVLMVMTTACLAFSCQGSKTTPQSVAQPRLADGADSGSLAAGDRASSNETWSCPMQDTLCPMMFDPVHCKLSLGERLIKKLDAENRCVGTLKLREAWCEAVAAEPELASTKPGQTGSILVPVLTCQRQSGDRDR